MKSIIIYISTLCIVLTFVSCGKDSTENKDHLVFVIMKALISLLLIQLSQKYNLIWACNHIFNGLLQLDEKLNISQSWTISPDAKPILLRCEGHLFSKAHFIW
jgi:peptide/nickel transport system substrate-binding protein